MACSTTRTRDTYISGEGDFFPAPGLQTIGSAGTIQPSFDNWTQNNTFGFYGQQEFAYNDRLFFTGAVRVDNNSAFGSQVHWVTYPKLSASYVVSDEPAIQQHLPSWLNSLRLRARVRRLGTATVVEHRTADARAGRRPEQRRHPHAQPSAIPT